MIVLGAGQGGIDPRTRQMLSIRALSQALGQFGDVRQQQRERQALSEVLAGKQGPGLGQLTQQGAPGMDPSLAGPALGMTQPGGMAQQGLIHTGGQMTPQMAQAFMLGGGDPAALAGLMPKQMSPYETAQVDIERQKLAQGSGPASGLGKVAADLGIDISTPEGLAAAQQAMIGSTRAPVTNINMPDQAKLSDIGTFRNQFTGLSGDFMKIRDAYGKLRSAAENPSPAGDLSMIFGYMKMLDPTSTVREGEQATAQNTTGAAGQLMNLYNRVITGERLTPEQRADFANQAHNLFQSQLQGQQELQTQYRGIAQQTMPNFDAANIVPDFAGRAAEWQPVAPPAAPANDPLGGAPVTSVYDIPGDMLRRGMSTVERFMGGGAAAAPGPVEAPRFGDIQDGHRYLGGDPADPASWEPIR